MKIVLDRWQGLGDNLQVSTIPRRMFDKYGEKCVWISDHIEYNNIETRQMVWENNPFIAGFTDDPGVNLTSKLDWSVYNWIERWERVYGTDEPYSQIPEVYLDNLDEDQFGVSDRVVADISYSVSSFNREIKNNKSRINNYKHHIENLLSQSSKKIVIVNNVNMRKQSTTTYADFLHALWPDVETETIDIQNLNEYANIMNNCAQFVCAHSGQHSLASAVRKHEKKFICFIPHKYHKQGYFVFPNCRYIVI